MPPLPTAEACRRHPGYASFEEHHALGQAEPERWAETGFIRKLRTKYSLTEAGGQAVLLYFRHDPECAPNYLNRVKLYQYT